jgi:hypothetical protein
MEMHGKSKQRVFLDVFSPPENESEVHFPVKNLVQALLNLSCFAVQHCSKDFISTIIEGCVTPIVEIKSLLEEKELSMHTEFLMVLLKFHEDAVRGREVGNSIVIQFRDSFEDKSMEGAIISLPNVVHLRVENGIRLRQGAFEPLGKA